MENKDGKWKFHWYNSDIWNCGDNYITKEEAIEAALSDEYRWDAKDSFQVGQIRSCANDVRLDAEHVLEWIADRIYEEVGEVAEDYLRDTKQDHVHILNERLNTIIKDWMKEFGYLPEFYKIVNVETVQVKPAKRLKFSEMSEEARQETIEMLRDV